jgi:hypothetical protein
MQHGQNFSVVKLAQAAAAAAYKHELGTDDNNNNTVWRNFLCNLWVALAS